MMEIIALLIVLGWGIWSILSAFGQVAPPPEPEETLDEQAERASAIDKLVNQIHSERL